MYNFFSRLVNTVAQITDGKNRFFKNDIIKMFRGAFLPICFKRPEHSQKPKLPIRTMLGFIIPFATIALAELGDKTQISLLVLSSGRRGNRRALLAGAMTAFLLVDGAAVAFGALAVEVIPMRWVKIASGVLFILFGLLSLRAESDDDGKKSSGAAAMSPFAAAFATVSILEWGDKTQVAAALFATKFHPAAVLTGTLAALAVLSAGAIWLGDAAASKINKKIVSRAAASIFIIMGIAAFFF